MRHTMRFYLYLLLITLFNFSCELNDPPNDEDLDKLTNVWVVEKVSIDGVEDIATDYSNFRLTIEDDNTYQMRDVYGELEIGQWELRNDNQLILSSANEEEKEYIILTVQSDLLVIIFKDLYFKESEANFEYTLVPEA